MSRHVPNADLNRAFTLVELIATMTILSIIGMIGSQQAEALAATWSLSKILTHRAEQTRRDPHEVLSISGKNDLLHRVSTFGFGSHARAFLKVSLQAVGEHAIAANLEDGSSEQLRLL